MSGDDPKTLGRRAILAAGAAGMLAAAVQALGAPSKVAAADHDPVKLGEDNVSAGWTRIKCPGGVALEGTSEQADGLVGSSGAATKSGLYAVNTNAQGYGVYARNIGSANEGYVAGPDHAIFGQGRMFGHAGVQGTHLLAGHPGVMGANAATHTAGVLGGKAGVVASAPLDQMALSVEGRAGFALSGILTIPAGKQSAKVTGVSVTALTFAVATLTQYRSGVWIAAAVTNDATDTLVVYLNKKVASPITVAWLLVERMPMA